MEVKTPRISGSAERLKVYIDESDMDRRDSLWRAIVLAAKREGLAGASVYRAIEGFGMSSRIHTAGLLDASIDLPIVVEIIDATEHIERFLPQLLALVEHGMVTREPVQVVHYAADHRNKVGAARPAQDIGATSAALQFDKGKRTPPEADA